MNADTGYEQDLQGDTKGGGQEPWQVAVAGIMTLCAILLVPWSEGAIAAGEIRFIMQGALILLSLCIYRPRLDPPGKRNRSVDILLITLHLIIAGYFIFIALMLLLIANLDFSSFGGYGTT